MTAASEISQRIVGSILSFKLRPNERLGEQRLATLFGCSRTVVREAMVELATRNIVTVSARQGWFLRQVDKADAFELYEARQVIETGLLRSFARRKKAMDPDAVDKMRAHLDLQYQALKGSDVGRRSYLLGDFHVRLAECLGNAILAAKLRDLTVLTTLFTMRHQNDRDAEQSFEEHRSVIDALESGDAFEAERRMDAHLSTWELKVQTLDQIAPLDPLQSALEPLVFDLDAQAGAAVTRKQKC